MLEEVPAWLGKVLRNARAGHGKLAVARLGGASTLHRDGFELRSAAFEDGEALDPSFTADEEDSVAPPLEWSAPPAGTEELALVVEDPDAPTPEPFCHWLVWGLAPQQGKLLEGETRQECVRQLRMAAPRPADRRGAARLRIPAVCTRPFVGAHARRHPRRLARGNARACDRCCGLDRDLCPQR
jgi:hypothetical protein